jgi:hypothetical protein
MLKMKPVLPIIFFFLIQIISAQPKKVWSKIFGGNNSDVCSYMAPYNDTMLISVGKSSSTNVGGNKGLDDFMVCQFKPNGDLIRIKTFGGPSSDQANSFTILPNGNLLIGGYVNGKGGDVASVYGLSDGWVLAYDPNTATKLWEKSYGGTNNDVINDIFFLEPTKIFLAGNTKSIDKDVVSTPTKGANDILIASIDEAGGLIKAFTFGGTKDESAKKIIRAESFGGQMLIFGESESTDKDFLGLNNGKKDIFILKINRNINKVFLTNIGGAGDDLFADAIYLGDEGMFVFGTVNTVGGQVDSLKGLKDIWMTRLDKNGVFLWSKNIGGKNDENAIKAQLTANNEIILLANSSSKDQDINANYGQADALLMKLDTSGNILWQKNYGGTGGENAGALSTTADGSIYFAAQSFSTNNDLPATNTAPPDFWTVKVFDCKTAESQLDRAACKGDTLVLAGIKFYSGKDTGTIQLKNATVNGCDSLIHVSIQFIDQSIEFINDSLCNEATRTINNVIFDRDHQRDTFHLQNSLGCDSMLVVDINFNTELVVSDTLIVNDNGSGTGCITLQVDGGCAPYTYEWNNGRTTKDICNIPAGTYTLVMTDCRSCSREFEFTVKTAVANEDIDSDQPLVQYLSDYILISLPGGNISDGVLYNVNGQKLQVLKVQNNKILLQRATFPGSIFAVEFTANKKLYRVLISN